MIDVKIIKKPKDASGSGSGIGIATNGNNYALNGVANEAVHAVRADIATQAKKADEATHATEADHALTADEADHAAVAHDLDSDSPIRNQFLSRLNADTARGHITMVDGLSVIGNAEVEMLTVRGDATVDGTAKANAVTADEIVTTPKLTTPTFRPGGLTGEGAGIYTDEGGLTHGEFDFIVARRGLTLSELTIEEINSVDGGIIASKGHGIVEKVAVSATGTTALITLKDVNQFVDGDYVRYAHYDYTNGIYRWAWVKVVSSSAASRTISVDLASFTAEMSLPEEGDTLVQMGHESDTARQGFVYITTSGVQCYDGVNTTSLVGKCRGVFGDLTGITDNGKSLSGYGVWTDTLYIGTGKTAYQTFTDLYDLWELTDTDLADYKTQVESRFDVVAGSLTSLQKSVTSLQTGGGRNLLLKTNQGSANWSATTNATYKPLIRALDTDGVSGVLFDYPNGNVSPTYESYDFQLRKELIKAGRTYTLSGSLKASFADSSHQGKGLVLYLATKDGKSHLIGWGAITPTPISGDWVSFTLTFKATATGATADGDHYVRFCPQEADRGALSSIAFRNLKLEEGDTATAWSAAPEDYVDGEITAVKSTMTEITQTVDGISARVEEVNTTLDGKIGQNKSAITATSTAITQEVTARKEGDAALTSTIEQTTSKISLRLSQMGLSNVNLARGTDKAFIRDSDFGNIENKTMTMYDVSGIATGDRVTLTALVRFKDITFGDGGAITFQLSGAYGYRGFPLRITEQYLSEHGVTPDTDGYRNLRIQATSTPITTEVTSATVGNVQMRLDYIDGSDGAVIEISQLKLELGDTATAWTARTDNLDEALSDTGIDISNRLITATADNFKVLNNNGAVTMEVDAMGNLTSNAVLVRNQDTATAQATPYLTTINLATGYIRLYYPLAQRNANDNAALEIGWDEASQSVFRFFNKEGVMAWKAGSQASLIDTAGDSVTTITPIELYKCKATNNAAAKAEIKTSASLTATRFYKKVVQTSGATQTTYYSNSACTTALSGFFTDPGRPYAMATPIDTPSDLTPIVGTGAKYSRVLYTINDGVMSEVSEIVAWEDNSMNIIK